MFDITVATAAAASLEFVKYGVTFTVEGVDYTISNSDEIDLGTYKLD